MTTWFATIALAIAVASVAIAVVATIGLVVVRAIRTRRQRRWLARDQRLRPLIFEIIDGGEVAVTNRQDRLQLISSVAQFAHNVRGADRATIAKWLLSAGALPEALRLMKSRSATSRARGIELFLPISEGRTAALQVMLKDENRVVRSLACGALGRAASIDAIPALLAATGSGRNQLPAALTMMAITRMKPGSARSVLVPAESLDLEARVLAINVTGVLNLTDARATLEASLSDSEVAIRIAALDALARLGLPSTAVVVEAHQATDAREVEALKKARGALDSSRIGN